MNDDKLNAINADITARLSGLRISEIREYFAPGRPPGFNFAEHISRYDPCKTSKVISFSDGLMTFAVEFTEDGMKRP